MTGRFHEVWAGMASERSAMVSIPPHAPHEEIAVAAYRIWSAQLMAGADRCPSARSLDLRKLRLTEGYREALRQAPGEQVALFGIWDAAYRILERLHWELAPPAIDPPPPPPPLSFAEVRRQYKAMKRDRARQAQAQTIHWHPVDIATRPSATGSDDHDE